MSLEQLFLEIKVMGTYIRTYHDDNNTLPAHNFACKYNVQNVDGWELHTLNVVRALCLGACGAHLYTLDLGEYMYTLCRVNSLIEIQAKTLYNIIISQKC